MKITEEQLRQLQAEFLEGRARPDVLAVTGFVRLLIERLTPRPGQVLIYSGEHGAFWRPGGNGYTSCHGQAGVFEREAAVRLAGGCGPEKMIQLRDPLRPAEPGAWLWNELHPERTPIT